MAEKPIDELVTILGFQYDPKGLEQLKKGIEVARGYTLKLVAGMGSLIGSSIYLAHSVASATDETTTFARQVGLSAKALEDWEYIAKKQGVESEDLRDAFKELTMQIGEARVGTGTMFGVFKEHNQTLLDQILLAKDTGEAFNIMVTALDKIEDPAERSKIAIGAFAEAGFKIPRIVNGGTAAIEKLRMEAKSLTFALSKEQVEAASVFLSKWRSIKFFLEGLKNLIGAQILPIVAQFASKIVDLAIRNKELIQTKIIEYLKAGIFVFKEVVSVLSTMGKSLLFISSILIYIIKFLGKLIIGVMEILGINKALAVLIEFLGGAEKAVKILLAAFIGFKALQIVKFIKGIVVALRIQAIAATQAGAAMSFATLGIPLLIGAVVAAITWLMLNWDKAKKGILIYFKYIADGFNNIVNIIKNKSLFKLLAAGARAFWDLWKTIVDNIRNGLAFFSNSKLFKGVMAVAGKIGGFFKGKDKTLTTKTIAETVRPETIMGKIQPKTVMAASDFAGAASRVSNTTSNSHNKKQVMQDIKLTINGTGDPQAVATAVSTKLKEMSDDTTLNLATGSF